MYVCMYVCIYVFTECIEISICIYTHGFTVSISVCYIICISVYNQYRTEKHVSVFENTLSEKHLYKVFRRKVVAEYDARPFTLFRFPSSRPNSCFPFAYCTALRQGIPSKYIRAHAFA